MPTEITNTWYTTLDRQTSFCFDFIQLPNAQWRVYIVQQPSYQARPSGSANAHWLSDPRGRYICWDSPILTLDAAKGVARAWADATQEYIRTGRFPPPAPAREVPDWSTSADVPWAALPGPVPGAPGNRARPAPPQPTPAPDPVRSIRQLLDRWRF